MQEYVFGTQSNDILVVERKVVKGKLHTGRAAVVQVLGRKPGG